MDIDVGSIKPVLIDVRGLDVGYDAHTVLSSITFHVNAGDYLCILGENGSGKSTLLKTLLGLQPSLSGEIIFNPVLKRNEIGYLPQQTEIQRDFPASVEEIVLSGCINRIGLRPFYNKEEKKTAERNMARVGILGLRKRCYRELSGGQQQRVLLARALCATKRVLLLDEPVTGLDPAATNGMYELIKELNEDGLTIIMISHDLSAAKEYADHILNIGKDTFFGDKDLFFREDLCTTL